MNKKQLLKTGAFLLVFIAIFGYLSGILRAKQVATGGSTFVLEEFYQQEKDTVDVCFMGSSQVIWGINNMKMYEDYGISSISVGSGDQPLLVTYFLLKEVDKRQSLKNVVLDMSMLYEKEMESRYRRNIDGMHWSINKLQAILAHVGSEEAESIQSYFIDWIKYHSRWKELSQSDFVYDDSRSSMHRGSIVSSHARPVDIPYEKFIIDNERNKTVEPAEGQVEWFLKIIEYCDDNDIDLLLIKTPKSNWSLAKHNGVQHLADEYGLDFLDFNFDAMLKEIGYNYGQDMWDQEHLNIRGADKLTDYLADYLLERKEYLDYRTVDGYSPGDVERYHKDYKDKYLISSIDVNETFSYLKDERYDLVIQSTEDISGGITEEMKSYLADMGVTVDLSEAAGKNYILAVNGGQCVYELISEEPLTYDGTFSDGLTYSAAADLNKKANEAAIVINEAAQGFAAEGMNIAVYDNEKGEMVDLLTIYTLDGALHVYNR
jgi:hypothetical protein